jgi:3-dehydroquinate synthase
MITVTVQASNTYDVRIGSGLLAKSGELAAKVLSPCRALILTDDHVAPLYADTLEASLRDAGFVPEVYVVPHGEGSKSLCALGALLEHLAEKHYTRTDALFALGGGVVGDLGGFCASVYLRGIPFVQIPTTLLSAVDSSVGGKTAINLNAGKNLAGAFYQPRLVICAPDTLSTLPPAILADGCAEVIKYGVIHDAALFRMLQDGTSPASEQVIARCVQNKRDIVEQDEFDTGLRRLLNLGHTVAHAIETLSRFEISHGSAVAMGTAAIMRAAVAHGLCPRGDLDALTSLTKKLGLPTECPYGMADVAAAALADKKRNGDTITLIVPYAIGDSRPYTLPADQLQAWLQAR